MHWYTCIFIFLSYCTCTSMCLTINYVKAPPQPSVLRNSLLRFTLFIFFLSDRFVGCSTWKCSMKDAGNSFVLTSAPAMPPGHLHIQWLLLNVQVRMGGIRMANAALVVAHRSLKPLEVVVVFPGHLPPRSTGEVVRQWDLVGLHWFQCVSRPYPLIVPI